MAAVPIDAALEVEELDADLFRSKVSARGKVSLTRADRWADP